MAFILVISAHGKSFSQGQIDLLAKVHGKKSSITFESKRFETEQTLLEFHKENKKNYDFIYYTLPVKMKRFLKTKGQDFGVVLAPRKNRRAIELAVVHHIAELEEEVAKAERRIPRKRGSKSYHNVPAVVRKNKRA